MVGMKLLNSQPFQQKTVESGPQQLKSLEASLPTGPPYATCEEQVRQAFEYQEVGINRDDPF